MELGGSFLSAEKMNEISSSILHIVDKMRKSGTPYDLNEVDNVVLVQDLDAFENPQSFLALFNLTQSKIEKIDEVADWINPHSSNYVFQEKNGALLRYVERWVDWINFNLSIVDGKSQKQQYVYTVENGKNEQLFDINGNKILAYEGYFN